MKKLTNFFFKSKLGQAFTWLIISFFVIMIPALIEELFSLNKLLSKPLIKLGEWETEGNLAGRFKFILLLFFYLPTLILLTFFMTHFFNRNKHTELHYQPENDYGKLIAELSMAINDSKVSTDLTVERVNTLFNALIDDMCKLYSLKRSDVRATIFYRQRGKEKPTAWRYGKSITIDQERLDLLAVATLLETNLTYPTWEDVKEQFENGDSETLFFIRNTGTEFKLGILLSLSVKVDPKPQIKEWAQLIYPFTMLGHMDKVVRFVINYKKEVV